MGNYEHHCFISWPHTKNVDIADCARTVKAAIESRLSESFVTSKVFLDESGLQGGDQWDPALRRALCRSMSMIAICAPVYFRSEHHWCGLEWASMYQLGQARLPNVTYVPIIPLMVRVPDPLPWGAGKIQFIDVSRVTIKGRKYFRTDEFRTKIDLVVKRIEAEEKSKGGIIIPDTAKEKPQEGEVVAVGPGGRDEAGKLTPMGVKAGDRVLFGKWSGTEVKLDGDELLIMKESDIMGVID